MSSDITIVVVGARQLRGPDSAALHANYRVDELHGELGRRLGQEVPVVHGTLGEAPRRGVLLLFCPSLDETLAEAPPDTAARVIWMNAGRTDVRGGLARHGLLGAVERFRYILWIKARAQDRAGGLYVRADLATALEGSVTADASVPGYVLVANERYQDLLSLICACAAVANRRPPPAPDRLVIPPKPPEFPIGQWLDMGGGDGYRIARAISGTPDRGIYEAPHVGNEERTAYVSLGPRQTVAWDSKRAELELPAEGFAPLLGSVRLDHEGAAYDAMVEARPPGVPLPDLLPGALSVVQAARILLPVLGWVAGAHRQGRVVLGLRPELIFAALTIVPDDREYLPRWDTFRPRPTGVVPRYERFLITAERPCYGFGPAFETLYLAPEHLMLRPPGPAADVYSLGAILAWMTSGAYPFPGDTMADRLRAIMSGAWLRDAIPEALTPLLELALALDPAARLTLPALEARLTELASASEDAT